VGDSFVEEGKSDAEHFFSAQGFGQNSEDSGLILTIPRKGYHFAADVLNN